MAEASVHDTLVLKLFYFIFYRRFGPKPFENLTFETVWDQTVNKFHNSFKTNRCNFFLLTVLIKKSFVKFLIHDTF